MYAPKKDECACGRKKEKKKKTGRTAVWGRRDKDGWLEGDQRD